MRSALLFALLAVSLAAPALAVPVPQVVKAVLKVEEGGQNKTIGIWDNSSGVLQVTDNSDSVQLDGAVENRIWMEVTARNAGDSPLEGRVAGLRDSMTPGTSYSPYGYYENIFNISRPFFRLEMVKLMPGEQRTFTGFYGYTHTGLVPGKWNWNFDVVHQTGTIASIVSLPLVVRNYAGYNYFRIETTVPWIGSISQSPSAYRDNGDGSWNVSITRTVRNTGTLPIEALLYPSCNRNPWYRGFHDTRSAPYQTISLQPGASSQHTTAFTLTPGEWWCGGTIYVTKPISFSIALQAGGACSWPPGGSSPPICNFLRITPFYDAAAIASYANKFYLSPNDQLIVSVPIYNFGTRDFTADAPLNLTLRLYNHTGVLYETSKLITDLADGTTLPQPEHYYYAPYNQNYYNGKDYGFTVSLPYSKLLTVERAESVLSSTPGLASRAAYWPDEKVLDFRTNSLDVARLIKLNQSNYLYYHLPIGTQLSFNMLLRNPIASTGYTVTIPQSKPALFQLTPSSKSYTLPPATGQAFPEANYPNEVTLGVPSGAAWAGDNGLCPNVMYPATTTSTADARATDSALLYVSALPQFRGGSLRLERAQGRAFTWQGPANLTFSEGATGIGGVNYTTSAPLPVEWSSSSSIDKPVTSCMHYLCCAADRFCSQGAFNSMITYFKIQAKAQASLTAFRRGGAIPIQGSFYEFNYTTVAQVVPGVDLSASGVSLEQQSDSCQGAAAYLVTAHSSDGRAWTYTARLLKVFKGDSLQGYSSNSALPANEWKLCGLSDLPGHADTSCDARPAILDSGKFKNLGAPGAS